MLRSYVKGRFKVKVEAGDDDMGGEVMDASVGYGVEEGIATVTMRRPQRLNALDGDLLRGLAAALDRARAEQVRALVLGGGGGTFSAGADLQVITESLASGPDEPLTRLLEDAERTVLGLARLPFPTVAALEGVAVGAGMGLALACDLRVAARSASLVTGYLRIGACPDAGVSIHLVRALGAARALALLLRNRPLSAAEMLSLGLVEEVVEDGSALGAARRLAGEVAGVSPEALLATRELVAGASGRLLPEQLDAERRAVSALWSTAGFRDGVGAVVAGWAARARVP
jgi:2-(1,2-epoxy-1,2-dihydrophenyl)acetyl-CoA isomerase